MSCTGCSSKFGLLHREYSCPNCQFSYCAKCLKTTVFVPKLGKQHKVCRTCCETINRTTASKTEEIEPPAALQKRMDALNKQQPQGERSAPRGDDGSSLRIEEIESRLQKLRQDTKDVIPIHADIEERLAKLKEVDVSYYRQPPITVYATDAEKASSLFAEVMHKVSIDRRRAQVIKSTTDEMERRLRCLRDLSRDSVDSGAQESKDEQSSDAPATTHAAELRQSAQTASDGKEDPPIDEVARLMSEELKAAEKAAKKSVDDLRKNKELMEELRKIKTKKTSTKKEDDDDPDSDDSAEADAIVAKVLEEARLEELGDLQELGLDEGGEVGS